jgi:hypothetical protein
MIGQVMGLVGASLVLLTLIMLKLGRISADSNAFDILNLAGCMVLLVAAIMDCAVGFIISNGTCAVISFISLIKRTLFKKVIRCVNT